MRKIIAIGGAPSSGTTLLADILDSIPGFSCPPEMYLLCFEEVHRFDDQFKTKALAKKILQTGAPYGADRQWFNRKYITILGLTEAELHAMTSEAYSLTDFMDKLGAQIERSQQRTVDILCEKTPININWADSICRLVPDGLFIHVVRSGPAVVRSLMRRGYTLYESTLLWTYQVATGLKSRCHNNYIEVRYEDLIMDPFGWAENISRVMGSPAKAAEIEECFGANTFRAKLPRPHSWTASVFNGKVIRPPDPSFLPEEEAFLADVALWRTEGSDLIARFLDLNTDLGYEQALPVIKSPEINGFLSPYVRYSRNLERQSRLIMALQNNVQDALLARSDIAFGEIIRLRRKFDKIARGK